MDSLRLHIGVAAGDEGRVEAAAAREEAWTATLGDEASAPLGLLRQRVREALGRFPRR